MSNATYSNLPPLRAEEVLENMREAKAKLDALGPVPVEIATNPAERLDMDSGPPLYDVEELPAPEAFGPMIRVTTDPDVPPGEWWVKKSDGSHEVHRGGLVKR